MTTGEAGSRDQHVSCNPELDARIEEDRQFRIGLLRTALHDHGYVAFPQNSANWSLVDRETAILLLEELGYSITERTVIE